MISQLKRKLIILRGHHPARPPRNDVFWYNAWMQPVIQKFASHAAADTADRDYYLSLTPQQRLDILLTLIERGKKPHEIGQKPARVYRIVKLPQR